MIYYRLVLLFTTVSLSFMFKYSMYPIAWATVNSGQKNRLLALLHPPNLTVFAKLQAQPQVYTVVLGLKRGERAEQRRRVSSAGVCSS